MNTTDWSELRDHTAERQLLAIALHGRVKELLALPPDAIDSWQHVAIRNAVRTVTAKGAPVDGPTVARQVVADAGLDSRAQDLSRLVVNLAMSPVIGESAPYYADRLAALHAARSLTSAVETFRNSVVYAAQNDDDQILASAVSTVREAIAEAETGFHPVPTEPPMSLDDLLAQEDEGHDWLVPGLLERMDRLIITGFEGLGKSMIVAQFALCIAGGLHPFTGAPIFIDDQPAEYRTLIFDCENSTRQMRRRYRRIADQVDHIRNLNGMRPVIWRQAVRIVSRPEGVSLADPRELTRLDQNIALSAPDLVVGGPLYKMTDQDIKDEQAAKALTVTLDELRVRHKFTLITEAHAGHSNDGGGQRRVRPIGSSLFLRWPEFGFGIAPHPDCADDEHPSMVVVKHWRGSREERDWPSVLKHGESLPWEPVSSYFSKDTAA